MMADMATEEIVETFLTRKDGLNHLLLSDVQNLLSKLAAEFSDVLQVSSIGQSLEGRDI